MIFSLFDDSQTPSIPRKGTETLKEFFCEAEEDYCQTPSIPRKGTETNQILL